MKTIRIAAVKRALFLACSLALCASVVSAQKQLCCPPGSEAPCCLGQWEGPYFMEISCRPQSGPACGSCTGNPDEIAHAALIPAGNWAGMVLLWTRCDRDSWSAEQTAGQQDYEYRTHLWDPNDPNGGSKFQPPIVPTLQNGSTTNQMTDPDDDGPFCSGHTWMLDEAHNPKFLVVGGNDRGDDTTCDNVVPPVTAACSMYKTYWFDPLAANENEAWSDKEGHGVLPGNPPLGPPELSNTPQNFEGLWYPSVITYLDEPNNKFNPIIMAGSGACCAGCGEVETGSGIWYQYKKWWTLSPTTTYAASSWAAHEELDYDWHQYPRSFSVYDVQAMGGGYVFTIGNTIICEIPVTGSGPQHGPYGGNPANIIHTSSMSHDSGPDPNAGGTTAGGLHYCNAVILHTLSDEFLFDDDIHSSPVCFDDSYDLNRIIVTGGQVQMFLDEETWTQETSSGGYKISAQPYTYELDEDGTPTPWSVKASVGMPRVFGNFVLLPDGSILLVGGQDGSPIAGPEIAYFDVPKRFNPGIPGTPGGWKDMAPRPIAGNHPDAGGDFATPRGYHSVALLLQDGTVALMGGQEHGYPYGTPETPQTPFVPANSMDSVEIFNPPYTFYPGRLEITRGPTVAGTDDEVYYGTSFKITVNKPGKVRYAVLIGIGSVTHHFDYGQRYIELMVNQVASWNELDNLEILAPPDYAAAMAPEGYYLLFVVEGRSGVKVPSEGHFVKLRFM